MIDKEQNSNETQKPELGISDVMCCFNKMTVDELKSKLTRTWIEETTNSGQIYRHYLNGKQVDRIMKILCNNT